VVGTLAVCFVLSDVATDLPGACPELTAVAALAYLMFNLFTPPCFAAIGAMNSEMKSAKWLWSGIALQIAVGYTVGYLVYTVGTLIVSPASLAVVPAMIGGIAVLAFAAVIAALIIKARKKA
jgi:ferrous iron transport protein B